MIEAYELSKSYGTTHAVTNATFTVKPGSVTGFLGPNGAGKSTTMRMIVGLDRPTRGEVLVNGRPYAEHRAPLCEVGALLDAKAVHPGRSARAHLEAIAASHGIGRSRVREVIELTGLADVAQRRAGTFSLGMGQRLGLAAALLGDPRTLILDEPVNGLDPEGVKWVRTMVRQLATEGRTVFLSSHLMSEMAQTADSLIVIGRGRIIAAAPISEILNQGTDRVRVRSPRASDLAQILRRLNTTITDSDANTLVMQQRKVSITMLEPEVLDVRGLAAAKIGHEAAAARIVLHELTPHRGSLEDAFFQLTAQETEYRSSHTSLEPQREHLDGVPA